MHHVHLSDHVYEQAKMRAIEAGFKSVEEFITDVVSDRAMDETEVLDSFFTEERLAHIAIATAQIESGEYKTAEQLREHFRMRFEA